MSDAKTSNIRQETHGVKESYTNIDEDLKNANKVNGSNSNTCTNTLMSSLLLCQGSTHNN